MNDFETLGVTQGMSPDEVKKAHRRLIMQHHPDVATDPTVAHNRTAEINAAFDRIKNGNPIVKNTPSSKTANSSRSPQGAQTPHSKYEYPNFDEDRGSSQDRAKQSSQKEAPHAKASQSSRDRSETHQSSRSNYARNEAPRYTRQEKRHPDRSERVSEAARAKAQRQNQSHGHAQRTGTERETLSEIKMHSSQKKTMQDVLEKRMQQEAHRRVLKSTGVYADPRKRLNTNRGDLPGFHMVEKIGVIGKTIRLHMAGDAKVGRNIIAMPEISQVKHNGARSNESGISVFEMTSEHGGKAQVSLQGGNGLKFELLFGQEKELRRSDGQR